MGQKITIEPVTRVEGHGKVTIHLDNEGKIEQTRLHIVEFRGFERFVQGRPYWEMPVLVQRLCGICPVSHHLAAAKAVDVIVGAGTGEGLTPTGEKMRRLMHYGQMFQSHSLHFFHLASPDLLFGVDADPVKRNVINVALVHRDLAVQGVMMRKPAERFEDLEVWQHAHKLVINVYTLTRYFPSEEKFGLISQMRRAGVSVAANIAEGFKKRGLKDKLNFYNIAQGSLAELRMSSRRFLFQTLKE